MRGQEAGLGREEGRNRFQFSVLDIAILLALHAVVINGTLELYRGWGTERDPYRGGLRQIGVPVDGSQPRPLPPESPRDRVVTVIGGDMRFTEHWVRRFATCVIVGSLAIVISFFGTALVVKNANQDVCRVIPRWAAALVSLLFLAGLSELNYLQHHPESYIEIHGRQIHPAIHAAWWAMGPAIAVVCIIVGVEIAFYLSHCRFRRPGAATDGVRLAHAKRSVLFKK